ncbi:MAG: TIGR04282 family arsenosugar biosynthesis glycosyltransferase [Proteobacteria bacterium]|nr:TIGR04282 family arsenosugar biosynthesis glycosyltransferase [Pseudomonadota bacterium]
MKNAIGLIFRIPEKGKVKTRLAKEIGEEGALYYYSLMLKEVIKISKNIKNSELIGFYRGDNRNFYSEFPLIKQKGNNLGEIIINATKELKKKGYTKIIIIGSDSPNIPERFFYETFDCLEDYDYVIGPTEDGGFYMLGCKNDINEDVFNNIEWGSNFVFDNLLNNLVILKKSVKILPLWYDVDNSESLHRWLNS